MYLEVEVRYSVYPDIASPKRKEALVAKRGCNERVNVLIPANQGLILPECRISIVAEATPTT